MNTQRPYILALILARAGSRGVPGKNIMPLAGRPLIAYSIDQALQSKYITRTIVSTDGGDIARVAQACGAEVPFMRPAELAGDFSPDIDAFRHCIEYLNREEGRLPELIVHLRATGPVRRVDLIDKAIALMLEHPEATALRSVSLASQTPYKMWLIHKGVLEPVVCLEHLPEAHSMGRQMLPKAYAQNGYIDIVRPETILQKNSMVGEHLLPFIVDEPTYDIDYPEDVPIVEKALLALQQETAHPTTREPESMSGGPERFPV